VVDGRSGATQQESRPDEELRMVATAIGTGLALVLGWLAGMLTHKRAERWCPACGSRLKCLHCAKAGLHVIGTPGAPR
jgi:hypothetical protein